MESHLQEGTNEKQLQLFSEVNLCQQQFEEIRNILELAYKFQIDEEVAASELYYDIDLAKPTWGGNQSKAPISQILHDSGFISSLKFTRFSYGQLLSQMQLPIGYLKSCPFWLQEKNINYHFSKSKRKFVILRKKYNSKGQYPIIRGVVSAKYPVKRMDNLPLLSKINEILLQVLPDSGLSNSAVKWTYNSSLMNETSIIDIIFQEEESCNLGIRIINSELGYKSFQVHPFISLDQTTSSYSGRTLSSIIVNEGPFSTWMNHTSGNANALLSSNTNFNEHLLYKILSKGIQGARAMAGHSLLEVEKTVIPVKEIDKLSSLSMPSMILEALKEEFNYKDKDNQIHQRAKKAEILKSIFKAIEQIGYFKKEELDSVRNSVTKMDEYIRASQAISGYLNFKDLTPSSLQSTFNSLLEE